MADTFQRQWVCDQIPQEEQQGAFHFLLTCLTNTSHINFVFQDCTLGVGGAEAWSAHTRRACDAGTGVWGRGPGRPSSILGPQERELRFLRLEHSRQTPPNETLPLQYVKHDFWSPSQLLLTKSNP